MSSNLDAICEKVNRFCAIVEQDKGLRPSELSSYENLVQEIEEEVESQGERDQSPNLVRALERLQRCKTIGPADDRLVSIAKDVEFLLEKNEGIGETDCLQVLQLLSEAFEHCTTFHLGVPFSLIQASGRLRFKVLVQNHLQFKTPE